MFPCKKRGSLRPPLLITRSQADVVQKFDGKDKKAFVDCLTVEGACRVARVYAQCMRTGLRLGLTSQAWRPACVWDGASVCSYNQYQE